MGKCFKCTSSLSCQTAGIFRCKRRKYKIVSIEQEKSCKNLKVSKYWKGDTYGETN